MSYYVNIEIDGSGAAFDDFPGDEFSRILHTLTTIFKRGKVLYLIQRNGMLGPNRMPILDRNGNTCGSLSIATE